MPTDPVCGMELDQAHAAAIVAHEGVVYAFCSEACSSLFGANPERFVGPGREVVMDPVCGMRFKRKDTPLHRTFQGRTFRFCSQECYEKFVLEPEKYAHPPEIG